MNPFATAAEREAHGRALRVLQEQGVGVLVGGAYAMFHYTGLFRWTKDLDLFLPRASEARARGVLADAGFRTEVRDPIWLSKAWWGDIYVDLIYSSGNGIADVDEEWMTHAEPGEAVGFPAKIVAPEEMIWSKGFVQERDRWDGADVSHLLRVCGPRLDWKRLLRRYGSHWEILLAHLMLFSYSYPHDRDRIPRWVRRELLQRAGSRRSEPDAGGAKVCRGTLLSRTQYSHDIGLWGYQDARELETPALAGGAVSALPGPHPPDTKRVEMSGLQVLAGEG
jgi:hypothetical protein